MKMEQQGEGFDCAWGILRTGLIKIGVVGGVRMVYRGRSILTDLDTKMKP